MALLLAPNRRQSSNPAPLTVSGSISNGADFVQTLVIVDGNGDQVTGVGSDTWQLQLRSDAADTSAEVTLTTATELTVTVGATTTLAINCPQATISDLEGDYIIDIASQTAGGVTTLRAHGKITVFSSPVSF